jgi:hypothetical protein
MLQKVVILQCLAEMLLIYVWLPNAAMHDTDELMTPDFGQFKIRYAVL